MFRFTIRDVLWLMVAVAMAVGWLVDRRMLFSELDRRDRNWYDLSRAIWQSGYEIDPNDNWHLIQRQQSPSDDE